MPSAPLTSYFQWRQMTSALVVYQVLPDNYPAIHPKFMKTVKTTPQGLNDTCRTKGQSLDYYLNQAILKNNKKARESDS